MVDEATGADLHGLVTGKATCCFFALSQGHDLPTLALDDMLQALGFNRTCFLVMSHPG